MTTKPKTKPASVEATVKKAKRMVLDEKGNKFIIDQLVCVTEHLRDCSYITDKDRAEAFPLFMHLSDAEMRKVRSQLTNELMEILLNEEYSYVQCFKMVIAIDSMFPKRKIPNKNNKIKFVKHYWGICCTGLFPLNDAIQKMRMLG